MTKVKEGYSRQLKYAALLNRKSQNWKMCFHVLVRIFGSFLLPHSLVVCTVAPTLTSPNDPLGVDKWRHPMPLCIGYIFYTKGKRRAGQIAEYWRSIGILNSIPQWFFFPFFFIWYPFLRLELLLLQE